MQKLLFETSRFIYLSLCIIKCKVINLMTGTIKKLTEKGFGFITAEGMGKDLFFHSNALVGVTFDELREGDAVSFETEDSPKGMNAVNVQRA